MALDGGNQGAPQQEAVALAPFRWNTRQRRRRVDTRDATSFSKNISPIKVSQIGLLSKLVIVFHGTLNFSSGGALAALGPWSLIRRVTVQLNQGTQAIFDCGGYGAYLVTALRERGSDPSKAGIGATTPNADIYAAGVASGDNTWHLVWEIPISISDGMTVEAGMLNLQAPELTLNIAITTGAAADIATNLSTINGTFTAHMEYYDVPDPQLVQLPRVTLHRFTQDTQPVTQTGANTYTVPRQGSILKMIQFLTLNGVRSNLWDSRQLVVNKNDTVYDEERYLVAWNQRKFYGQDLPVGVNVFDFFHTLGIVADGDQRDLVDSERAATLESIINVTPGSTLGAGNNFYDVVREFVQTVQPQG